MCVCSIVVLTMRALFCLAVGLRWMNMAAGLVDYGCSQLRLSMADSQVPPDDQESADFAG